MVHVQRCYWFNWFSSEKLSRSLSKFSCMDSTHATEVCSACWQHVSLTLHISLKSTHDVLYSHNPELLLGLSISLSQWATSLSEKNNVSLDGWMDRWIDGWMDRRISGYICLCSSVRPLQCNSNPVYLHRSIFVCVPEKRNCFGMRLWAWDIVWNSLPNGLFSQVVLFFQSCILLLLIQPKNSNCRGLPRASDSQI